MKITPDIREQSHWRFDLIAGISVALVALPIGLALAIASGYPPLAGVVASIVGGVVCTFYRGSHVAINGPGAGMIVIMLATVDNLGYELALGAAMVAGLFQVALGLLKLGKMGKFLPASVIFGMLAFVGIAIFAKQFYIMLGTTPDTKEIVDIIKGIPAAFGRMNPFIFILSLNCLLILIIHAKVKSKFVHFIPAPIWVLLFSILWVLVFKMDKLNTINFRGSVHELGNKVLIDIPDFRGENPLLPKISLLRVGIPQFDFENINFWLTAISITLVSSIYSLVGAKAVDKLDPQKRDSNLNKELIAIGLGTAISSSLGGLPVITAPVQSSVNVNHDARTKWSNLIKGITLLLVILYASHIIQLVPYGALAAILVFTGFKLASPKLFTDKLQKGWEQFMILGFTITACLFTDLITGVFAGIVFTLLLHYLRSGLPSKSFFHYMRKPTIRIKEESEKKTQISLKGILNFANYLKLERSFESIPQKKSVVVDFSHARLIDYTTLENVHNFAEKWERAGGRFSLVGLEIHATSSQHPYSLHILESKLSASSLRLTRRQEKLKVLAASNHWKFEPEKDWKIFNLKKFPFFSSRPLEYTKNRIYGAFETGEEWLICDAIFDEGTLQATEEFHTTVMLIEPKLDLPIFRLDKEMIIDRLIDIATHEEIDLDDKKFSKTYSLKGKNKEKVRSFFNEKRVEFFNKGIPYHVESKGDMILIFRNLRFASAGELENLYKYGSNLLTCIKNEPIAAVPS